MATLDIVTAAEAGAHIKGATSDAKLATIISAASATIDDLAGPVVVRTITDELHDGGSSVVILDYRPVSSVTSVAEYDRAGTATSLTAEDYDTKPAAGFLVDGSMIYRRSSGSSARFASGERNVRVTYVAGRAATTSVVAAKFKLATLQVVAHLWAVEYGTGGTTFGDGEFVGTPTGFAVPRRAVEILGPDVQVRVGVA